MLMASESIMQPQSNDGFGANCLLPVNQCWPRVAQTTCSIYQQPKLVDCARFCISVAIRNQAIFIFPGLPFQTKRFFLRLSFFRQVLQNLPFLPLSPYLWRSLLKWLAWVKAKCCYGAAKLGLQKYLDIFKDMIMQSDQFEMVIEHWLKLLAVNSWSLYQMVTYV